MIPPDPLAEGVGVFHSAVSRAGTSWRGQETPRHRPGMHFQTHERKR